MNIIKNNPRILIVDDNDYNLDLVSRILAKTKFETFTATNGFDAIHTVKLTIPDLILLDGMMPMLDGFETCRQLKSNPSTCNIPIIFMTALDETENKVKAFKLGASDYITKPFQKAELLARVKRQLELNYLRQELEKRNNSLQLEIHDRYEAEISLLDLNERLIKTNGELNGEIKNHEKTMLKLQNEIIERKQAESEVRQSLKEKELLLKEVHHRVKNNLFIVSSLLESQAGYVDSPSALKMLSDSQNRIMSMALIHEQLHCRAGLCQIDFQQYLTTLCNYLVASCLTDKIYFEANIQKVYLNIETANPCGLMVNELISNAVEHAFVGRLQGKISLDFQKTTDEEFTLIITDDGLGFPSHKDFFHSDSLGLELVSTLVEQLEGNIEMKNSNGTEIKITFQELNYQKRI